MKRNRRSVQNWRRAVRATWPAAQSEFDSLVDEGVDPEDAFWVALEGISFNTDEVLKIAEED